MSVAHTTTGDQEPMKSTTDRMQDSTAPDVHADITDRTACAIAEATAQDRID